MEVGNSEHKWKKGLAYTQERISDIFHQENKSYKTQYMKYKRN